MTAPNLRVVPTPIEAPDAVPIYCHGRRTTAVPSKNGWVCSKCGKKVAVAW